MIRPLLVCIAALATALLALPAEAQWKWRDKAGHTQYSDLPPPPGTAEQDIMAKPGLQKARNTMVQATAASGPASGAPATAASGGLAPRLADPELEAKRKKAEAEVAAKTKADEERVALARSENCIRAKSQVKTLDSGIRLARANEKGEREILDDKQRADEIKRARDVVANDCK